MWPSQHLPYSVFIIVNYGLCTFLKHFLRSSDLSSNISTSESPFLNLQLKRGFPLSSYLPYEITYVILVYWSMIYPHLVECKFHWVKNHLCFLYHIPLPCWLSGNESACNAGDPSLIPGWGRSPGERKGYPLQYSCLENSMKREVWQATVHGVAAGYNKTTKRIYNIPYRPELGFK